VIDVEHMNRGRRHLVDDDVRKARKNKLTSTGDSSLATLHGKKIEGIGGIE
jgi:hypothetical protein